MTTFTKYFGASIENVLRTRSVVYKADVTSTDDNTTQTYIGVTANDFKTRYRNHLKFKRSTRRKRSYPNTSGT